MSATEYSKYGDWKGWTSRKFGECDAAVAGYFAAELRLAGIWPLSSLKLLEVGIGNGDFAQWSVAQGACYVGTEKIPALVSAGCAAGFRVLQSECALAEAVGKQSLDAVVAFDVFEHLELGEFEALLEQLRTCLKPGGRILARVPSGDSPFARPTQYGDITHKLILGSSAIRQIAARCELEVLQVREPAFPIVGQGLRSFLRRGVVKLIRTVVFPVLRSAFMGNAQAVLTPNVVFVLRKPD